MKQKFPYLYLSLSAGLILMAPNLTQGQPTAHYCPGVEGLQCATLPPPGFYFRDYNMFYMADRLNNSSGQSAGPANFRVFSYAQIPRLVWMSGAKFLGADVGTSALLPCVDESLRAGPYNSATFGIGDLMVDGILAWHPQRFDVVLADAIWAPTGEFAPAPTTRAGLGYWGNMPSVGGTWYMDKDKTWTVSALNRYEINGEQRDTHVTPGEAYTLEWGVGKSFLKSITGGAAGYYQQRVTADRGAGASGNGNRVAAVGPEISAVIPKIDVNASLRLLYEFTAENRARGETITLTLTKRF